MCVIEWVCVCVCMWVCGWVGVCVCGCVYMCNIRLINFNSIPSYYRCQLYPSFLPFHGLAILRIRRLPCYALKTIHYLVQVLDRLSSRRSLQ